jgi:CheY-like chemotaxis protein
MLTSNPKDWRILLVDDEPDNLAVLEMVLTYHGAACVTERSAKVALERLQNESFDLALVDIRMPVMSGQDLLKAVRDLPDFNRSDMVLIAITAHAMTGDRERMIAAGFNGYISKPVEVSTIMDTIRQIIESYLDQRNLMMGD